MSVLDAPFSDSLRLARVSASPSTSVLSGDALRLVPLGGLGEIGMNCMAIEADGQIVVVDCGVMFPDRTFGADLIHPDFSYLVERQDAVRAVLITHGHEDHIGAVPFLLQRMRVPVYGPPYALALIRERLREHGLEHDADLRPTRPRDWFRVGTFEVEPVRVTHSIVDSTALAIRAPQGLVLHSGDFKFDDSPGAEADLSDEARLAEIGREGVRVLLSDSTNADVAGTAGTEASVAGALEKIVREAQRRIVIALFASNVQRLSALMAMARATRRRVCLLGRSMNTHARIAVDERYLRDPGDLLVAPEQAQSVPANELMVLATGTQGEPAAALARLAEGTHPALQLEPGDEIVLSARVIPGHEREVHAILDRFERRGLTIHAADRVPEIHVSGHACQAEQRRMIDLAQPLGFLPVHGNFHHLRRHAAIAIEAGIPEALVAENGAVVELDGSGMRIAGAAPVGKVHVNEGGEIPDEVLRERALLAELGSAVVFVPLDGRGRLRGEPDVVTRGVTSAAWQDAVHRDASRAVFEALDGVQFRDAVHARESAERALRRHFFRHLRVRPLTSAVIVRGNP